MHKPCNTEHYQVSKKKAYKPRADELLAWYMVYCKRDICNRDAHNEFAEMLSISREDAKTLAHKITVGVRFGVENLWGGV